MSFAVKQIYQFEDFRLDAGNKLLLRGMETVPIPPKVFDLLLILVKRSGTVVEKEELMNLLWPDTIVEENNLTVSMSMLRKALGDGKDGVKLIETIPRRGYRFVAKVQEAFSTPPTNFPDESFLIPANEFSSLQTTASIPDSVTHPTTNGLTHPTNVHDSSTKHHRQSQKFYRFLGGTMLLLVVVGAALWRQNLLPVGNKEIRSLAVLPFKPLAPLMVDAMDESLGLGLADALITRLSNTGKIVVRPTSAIINYSKPDQDLMKAAKELEVDALLDGRVQRVGDRIRITVQFLRASNGEAIWGESFDEQFTNILTVQNIISEKVARALTLKLTEPERQLLNKKYTDNTQAFELYLKGRYFLNKRSPEGANKAVEFFRQAIALDPNFALAYVGITDSYVVLGTPQVMLGGQRTEQFWEDAKAAARKALELDPMLAEAYASLGAATAASFNANRAEAHRAFDRAIQLNPNYPPVYVFYAIDLVGAARLGDALQYAIKARQLDPVSVSANATYGMLLCRLRRPQEAIDQFKKTLELDPNNIRGHWGLGLVYEQLGRYDDAIAEHQLALQASNGGVLALASLGRTYALAGRRQEAETVLQQLLEKERKGDRHPYYLAALYLALGDQNQAFDLLENNQGRYSLGLLQVDQFFDTVRQEPRYLALIK